MTLVFKGCDGHCISGRRSRYAKETIEAFLQSGYANAVISECDISMPRVFNALNTHVRKNGIENVTVSRRNGRVFLTNENVPQIYPFVEVNEVPSEHRNRASGKQTVAITLLLNQFEKSNKQIVRIQKLPEGCDRKKLTQSFRTIATKRFSGIGIYCRDENIYLVNKKKGGNLKWKQIERRIPRLPE